MSIQVILGFNKFLAPLMGISLKSFGNSGRNLVYTQKLVNKFLVPLLGISL